MKQVATTSSSHETARLFAAYWELQSVGEQGSDMNRLDPRKTHGSPARRKDFWVFKSKRTF